MNKLLKQAFTLIELLVVIAIIGILSGLIVVSMSGVTQKANVAKAQVFSNSLRNALMANIVGEWKFDGTAADGATATNSDVLDTWGSANNGTIPASPAIPTVKTGSNCVSGSCLSFDGSNDYVNLSSNGYGTFNLQTYTISLWVKPLSLAQKVIWSYDYINHTNPYYACHLRIEPNGSISYSFNNGTASVDLSAVSCLSINNWHNIVVSYKSGEQKIYVNGKLITSAAVVNTVTYYNQQVWIGGSPNWAGYINAIIDDVRFYDSVAPISQIKEQYYIGLNKLLANKGITNEEYLSKIISLALK